MTIPTTSICTPNENLPLPGGRHAPPFSLLSFASHRAKLQASATYVCINNGGNHPNAANKQDLNGPLPCTVTKTASKKGDTIGPVKPCGPLDASSIGSPNRQTMILVGCGYSKHYAHGHHVWV
jgi:hypothetical protein